MTFFNPDMAMKVDMVYYSMYRDIRKVGIEVEPIRKSISTKAGRLTVTTFLFNNREDMLFYLLIGKYKPRKKSLFNFDVRKQDGQ